MGDLLLALLAFTAIMALGLSSLAGLTVVPFVSALHLADRRGLSAARVGTSAAAGILLGLALAGTVLLLGAPVPFVLVAVITVWAVPVGLRLLGAPSIAGRAGRHS